MLLRLPRRTLLHLALILLAACSLRLWQLERWLPEFYEEATPVLQAREFWGREHFDFNPHFFNYPAFSFHTQFAAQVAVFAGLYAAGDIASLDEFRRFLERQLPDVVLLGRVLTVLFDLGSVALVFLLGLRVADRKVGLLAAALLATSALHVRMAQYVLVDVPLVFFTLLALLWMIDVVEKGGCAHFIKVGIALGLAASTKYTAGLLAAPLVAAALWGAAANGGRAHAYRNLVIAAAVALCCFFAINPYILLDFTAFWSDFSYEREHMQIGHFGRGAQHSTVSLYAGNLAWAVGVVGGVALWGFAANVRQRHVPSLLLYGWIALYVIVLSTWEMHGERYLMPVIAIVLLLGARAAVVAADQRPRYRTSIFAVLLVCYLAPQAYQLSEHYRSVAAVDTRQRVGDWVEANVARGSLVALEHYSYYPDRQSDDLLLFRLPFDILRPEHFAGLYVLDWYENFDYVLTSSFIYQRYLAEPDRFAVQLEFYRHLREEWHMVQHVRPNSGPGPDIVVYRNPHAQRSDGPFPVSLYQGVGGIQLDLLGQFFADLEFALRTRGYGARAASVGETWVLIERLHAH